ncbi:MAG TPA: BREX system P-loop protein BrxC [Anaerolineae bacterium]|nr:BREX system P-loop protein BrxC [Anaerolineae bacterium]
MRIRDVFATTITERIEPVVKVADRRPMILRGELAHLVVTPQWEHYLRQALDAYVDAARRDDEQGIAIWISGFFGSGKSLFMKVLGAVLEGGRVEGQPVRELFLSRVPATSRDFPEIERLLRACEHQVSTTAVGGNLYSQAADPNDPLVLRAFKLFAAHHGYTFNWPLAWAIEYQVDAQGRSGEFRQQACDLCGTDWEEISTDPEIYLESLYRAASAVLPNLFADPAAADRAASAVVRSGVTPAALVRRLRNWCEARDQQGLRHKVLLQLDELGQWISAGNANERTMQVQALAEEAAQQGAGRVWLAVTAHGDIQALAQNVQQENYARIIQRFKLQCRLSNEDIGEVVGQRILRKDAAARSALAERFDERSGELVEMGSLAATQRAYPIPDGDRFAQSYPYMPWTVAVIPDTVKGIAQAAGRDEALTGSNRTMIGVVQGALIETPGFLDKPVGSLVSLADLYSQLESDVPIETKSDLSRIKDTVLGATQLTLRVARGLFLLCQAQYIPATVDNVARAIADSVDVTIASMAAPVREELERLVDARYAKRVGEKYLFLTTRQRTFQDRVHSLREELLSQANELIQALKTYEGETALRFDRVSLQGRDLLLRLEIDGRIARNPSASVTLHVYSPLQRSLDSEIGDDTAMKHRSNGTPDEIYFRLADVTGLRAALAVARATEEVAGQILQRHAGQSDEEVARQALQVDLPDCKVTVRKLLETAVRGGVLFFRGGVYQLAPGDGPAEAVRATLSQILPSIYPRFSEVLHRIGNEATAVKAALAGNIGYADLRAMNVYRADGTLDDGHPLLSTLRGKLPLPEQGLPPANASAIRSEFERPPFGWDGNVVKVGLALLLRAALCRLIHNGQTYSDPAAPQVVDLLTKEASFSGLRVQGVHSEITIADLIKIRDHMDAAFAARPALVEATMNNELGARLATTAQKARAVQTWAATAQCPLPLDFESGTSLVEELLNTAAASARLARFLEQGTRLCEYTGTLASLAGFQQEQGVLFVQVREFYLRMLDVPAQLPQLQQFLTAYRASAQDRSFTQAARWNEVVQAYRSATQAVTAKIAELRDQVLQQADAEVAKLESQVRSAGVPEEHVISEVSALATPFERARQAAGRPDLSLGEAVGLLSPLTAAVLGVPPKLRDLKEKYRTDESHEIHLTWHQLAGRVEVRSAEELDAVLQRLRVQVGGKFGDDTTVIIE